MSNFFSINDGNLTDAGVFAKSIEISDSYGARTGVWLAQQEIYSLLTPTDGSTITGLAINLSAINPNPMGNLTITYADVLGTTFTENYPVSSFSKYGASSFNSRSPSNWQVLKFTNPVTPPAGDDFRLSFKTDYNDQLSMVGVVTAINAIDGNFVALQGRVSYSNPFNSASEISVALSGNRSEYVMFDGDDAALYDISTGDFTVEGWYSFNVLNVGVQPLWSRLNEFGNGRGIYCLLEGSNRLAVYFSPKIGVGYFQYSVLTNFYPTKNVFYHIAVVRYGDVMSIYVDGKMVGTGILPSNTVLYNTDTHWSLGRSFGPIPGNGNTFEGLISNFRIVKKSLYTSNFETATTPVVLDTNTVALFNGTGNAYDSSRILDGTNHGDFPYANGVLHYLADNRNIELLIDTFSPYANNKGSSFRFHGDDSEYISSSLPSIDANQDWSLEFWYYHDIDPATPNGGTGTQGKFFDSRGGSIGHPLIMGPHWHPGHDGKDIIINYLNNQTSTVWGGWVGNTAAGQGLERRRWYHVALVKNGTGTGNAKLYVNGNNILTFNYTWSYLQWSTLIGRQWEGYAFTGYLCDMRLLKGVGTFQGVPTEPYTVDDNPNTYLLLSYNKKIVNKANTSTNYYGGALVITSEKKNNTGSLYFSHYTSALYARERNTNYSFGLGDFTIEFWMYQTYRDPTYYGTILDFRNVAGWVSTKPIIRIRTDGCISWNNDEIASQYPITLRTWTHVAFCRKNGKLVLFINGKPDSFIMHNENINANDLTIGKLWDQHWAHGYYGCLDDIHVSKVARYDWDVNAPTNPLSITPETSYLMKSGFYYNKGFLTDQTPSLRTYNYGIDNIHITGVVNSDATYKNNTVTVNNLTAKNIFVHKGGTLQFPTNANKALTLNGSNGLQVTSEGTLNIGTSSNPIPANVNHSVLLSGSFLDVHDGGNLRVYGASKTPFAFFAADTRRFDTKFEIVGEILPSIRWRRQPVLNQQVYVGRNASFSASAYGDGTISYQWYRSDTGRINNERGVTYTLISAATADHNISFYSIASSTSAASITSVYGALEVIVPSLSFVLNPLSGTTYVNRPATFSVSAVGDGNIAYSWSRSDTGVIPNTNSTTYTIPNLTLADDGLSIYCVASSTFGLIVSSRQAVLSARVPQIRILTQPSDLTTFVGQSAKFTLSAEGDGILTYQWSRSDTGLLLGSTSTSYSKNPIVISDNNVSFFCDVKSDLGTSVRSNRALLTAPIPQLNFVEQPQNTFAWGGRSAFFSASAVGDGSSISYQWKRSDTGTIVGATSSGFLIGSVNTANDNNKNFYCVASSNLGVSVTSSPARLSAADLQLAFLIQPAGHPYTIVTGSNTFTASAAGNGDIALQWYRSDVGRLTGEINNDYTLLNAALSDNRVNFYCVASSTFNLTVTSSMSELSTRNAEIKFVVQPLSSTVGYESFPVTYTVQVAGDGVVSYLWNRSDSGDITGSNSDTLTFNAQLSDNGVAFKCVASSTIAPTITSDTVTLSAKTPEIIFL